MPRRRSIVVAISTPFINRGEELRIKLRARSRERGYREGEAVVTLDEPEVASDGGPDGDLEGAGGHGGRRPRGGGGVLAVVVACSCRGFFVGVEQSRAEMGMEDDAAERAHGLNEARPLRLLWSTGAPAPKIKATPSINRVSITFQN